MSVAWADMSEPERNEVKRLLRKSARLERQFHLKAFVALHDLSCFRCGSSINDWAKTGTTNGRHWAICMRCVRGVDGAGPRLRSASTRATQRTGAVQAAPPLRQHPTIGEANPFHEDSL